MLDFVSKENSFQTKVNPTTDTVQKKELVDNSSESVYDNLKNGINTIQMKQTSNSSTIQFEKGYAFADTKSDKGRGKLGRIFKGGLLGAVATYMGGYGSKKERRDFKAGEDDDPYMRIKGLSRAAFNHDNDIYRELITIDIPGKKKGSTNELRGYAYQSGVVAKNGKAVILFSGSGGNNRDQLQPIAEQYAQQGYVCFGIDYRGFGHSGTEKEVSEMQDGQLKSKKVYSSGMISENRIYEDSRIIYNYVLSKGFSPNNIILHGFSLGGAVASNLAVEISQKAQGEGDDYKLGGLVMHSPMTSTSEMGKDQGNEIIKGIGGLLGSIKTKGAMGSMSTKKNLLALQELDADLPIAFMSGVKGLEGHSDHLDYEATGILNYVEKDEDERHIIKNVRANGGHLENEMYNIDIRDRYNEFKDNMRHMRKWKDMQRSNPVPTTQAKSIDSVRHTPSSEQTVQGKFESSNNTGLPDGLKTNIESLSGYSMNDVKVHYNSPKPAQMKALAYTQGTDIHVAPGQEKHLGHEAWHVVQQKQGRVQPTTQMKGVNINDNASLEREADIMGTKATQLKAVNNTATVQKKNNSVVQMKSSTVKKLFSSIKKIINDINIDNSKDKKIFKKIKNAFATTDNINTIIGKTFSSSTGASMDKASENVEWMNEMNKDLLNNITNDLKITIFQTLNDILYWTKQKNKGDIENIKLTDSDVHVRGVGVCIVTFKDNTQLVIKPEDKTFEKTVYGSNEESLAKDFNKIEQNNRNKDIGTLNIDTGDGKHGSAVEYFEHNDLFKKNNNSNKFKDEEINKDSLNDIIEFASLLGLGDLHHENLVYGKEGYRQNKAQLIDAEIGLKFSLSEQNELSELSGLSTSIGKSEMFTVLPYAYSPKFQCNNDYIDKLTNFLEKAKDKLRGKKSRRVLISTGQLYTFRTMFYKNDKKMNANWYKDKIKETNTFQEGGWEILDSVQRAFDLMIEDFKKGRIPFYEHDFATGVIVQKFSNGDEIPVLFNPEKTSDKIINKNIEVLTNMKR